MSFITDNLATGVGSIVKSNEPILDIFVTDRFYLLTNQNRFNPIDINWLIPVVASL